MIKTGDVYTTKDGSQVDWIEEESFFFKLSEWQEKLLNFYEENPDFVIITNETDKHLKTAIKFAQMGCHIFIEKPLSHSLTGIKKLEEIIIQPVRIQKLCIQLILTMEMKT